MIPCLCSVYSWNAEQVFWKVLRLSLFLNLRGKASPHNVTQSTLVAQIRIRMGTKKKPSSINHDGCDGTKGETNHLIVIFSLRPFVVSCLRSPLLATQYIWNTFAFKIQVIPSLLLLKKYCKSKPLPIIIDNTKPDAAVVLLVWSGYLPKFTHAALVTPISLP